MAETGNEYQLLWRRRRKQEKAVLNFRKSVESLTGLLSMGIRKHIRLGSLGTLTAP